MGQWPETWFELKSPVKCILLPVNPMTTVSQNRGPGSDHYEDLKAALIKRLEDDPSNPYSAECLADLQDNKLFIKEGSRPIGISWIKQLYTIRSKRAKKLNHPIYGFDELLNNLSNTDKQLVCLHAVEGDRYYLHGLYR